MSANTNHGLSTPMLGINNTPGSTLKYLVGYLTRLGCSKKNIIFRTLSEGVTSPLKQRRLSN